MAYFLAADMGTAQVRGLAAIDGCLATSLLALCQGGLGARGWRRFLQALRQKALPVCRH